MGKFVADPPTLLTEGNKLLVNSESFNENIEKIYSTLDNMIQNDYLSPEAKVIAQKIEDQRETLNEMRDTIARYGTFSKSTGNRVIQNSDNIISEIQ